MIALLFAVITPPRTRAKIVEMLKETGVKEPPRRADAREPTKEADPPEIPREMLEAIEQGQSEIAQHLLNLGIYPNTKNEEGRTALLYALWRAASWETIADKNTRQGESLAHELKLWRGLCRK